LYWALLIILLLLIVHRWAEPTAGESYTPLNAARDACAAHPVAALGWPIRFFFLFFRLGFRFHFVCFSVFLFLSFLFLLLLSRFLLKIKKVQK
jgi:hypothetical protein